jgi:hypothetical protein
LFYENQECCAKNQSSKQKADDGHTFWKKSPVNVKKNR